MTSADPDAPTSTEPHPESTPSDAPATATAPGPATESATAPPTQNWSRSMARRTAAMSAKLGPLARHGADVLAAASPKAVLLALLGLLAALSMVAALAFDGALGVASTVVGLPVFSAAAGAVAVRWLDDRRATQARRDEAGQQTSQVYRLERTLDYVDAKLTTAITQFGSERHNDAVIAMFQAKAVTEFSRGTDSEQGDGDTPALSCPPPDLQALTGARPAERPERVGLALI